ncbi:MerR family transcriptional regulator [Bacillus mobilis]|uniref:MerR family transcriptional regulator n=2 Tax=Bacillus cereus group TaxID=86661 RepID=A0A1C4CL49_BACCE|nr:MULTISPECIES: MerR family transcriptional regulator [Bacillus cereus group]MCU5437078.1 MerR family transcriptional regulator [Bacillus mobilis]MCU5595656.1 MerR family transcriptional regulator [Bacillus mobilis]MCU5738810.1 MerR family transcriptional regulator [Bacillus mobilis]MCU9561158.1 MerR family transcriptional regulator [Bacillus mobilis]OKA37570.1 MerR family transcriptional regulator [Bacillus cereus]
MFKIGDFSKLSSISIRMLRHYDKVELLQPVKVDEQSGYRYYSAAQLKKVNQIQTLKDMGFNISTIKEIVESENMEVIKSRFENRSAQIKGEMDDLQKQLRLLEASMKSMREDVVEMNYHVSIKEIPERNVASVRKVIPSYNREGDLWGILMQEIHMKNISIAHPSYSIAVFHDREYKENDVDVEIRLSILGKHENTKDVTFKKIESTNVASITVNGSYEQMTAVNEAAAKWIETEGYELVGPMFNIYHVSPAMESDPNKWVTEVCYPVK